MTNRKTIRCVGQSDDCGTISGIDLDESCAWGHWFPLEVDGVIVGDLKPDYEGDWVTSIRPLEGHTIKAILTPEIADLWCPECGCEREECDCVSKLDLGGPGRVRVIPGRTFGCSVITGFEFDDYVECSELAWRVRRQAGLSLNYCHEHLMELEGIDLPLDF